MAITPEIAAIVGVVGSLASAGVGAASAAGAFGGKPSAPKIPTPTPLDTSAQAKALLPEARANAAANAGGGFSPQFLAGMLDQQTGTPGAGLGILGDITRTLGQNP
jgi:hypothetical protein